MSTPLVAAANANDLQTLKQLLNDGADVNQTSGFGITSLYIACKKGILEAVNMLLEHPGINPNLTSKKGTPLHIACKNRHLAVVEALLKHPDINPNLSGNGDIPLYTACKKGILEVVNALLKHPDINPNLATTPFAFVNLAGEWRVIPLYVACQEGHLAVVKALLKHPNIDPNYTILRLPPLHIACANNHFDIVEALLEHPDIKPNQQTWFGGRQCYNPLHIACDQGHSEVVKLLKYINPNQVEGRGLTPLYIACENKRFEVMKILIDHNVMPTESNIKQFPVLKWYIDSRELQKTNEYIIFLKNQISDLWTKIRPDKDDI